MRKFQKGLYNPKNKEKLIYPDRPIRYLSSWELKIFQLLDGSSKVQSWASEPFPIKYFNPLEKKYKNYYPDLLVKMDNNFYLIEIKPFELSTLTEKENKQIKENKLTKKLQFKLKHYLINMNKWKAAKKYCLEKNITFLVLTEKEIFKNWKL